MANSFRFPSFLYLPRVNARKVFLFFLLCCYPCYSAVVTVVTTGSNTCAVTSAISCTCSYSGSVAGSVIHFCANGSNCQSVSKPSGSSYTVSSSLFCAACGTSCAASLPGGSSCSTLGLIDSREPISWSSTCIFTYIIEGIDVSCKDDPSQPWCANEVFNPPCTDPLPVPDGRCKGGTGLWAVWGNNFPPGSVGYRQNVNNYPLSFGDGFLTITRPDGSDCDMSGLVDGTIDGVPSTYADNIWFACPLGFTDDVCEAYPDACPSSSSGDAASSDSGGSSSGSSSSSSSRSTMCDLFPGTVLCPSSGSGEPGEPGEPDGGDSGGDYCDANPGSILCVGYGSSASAAVSSASAGQSICEEFPYLAWCQETGGDFSAGSGGGSSAGSGGDPGNPGSGGGVSGGTGDCKDFRDCDWAKLDVQLTQLGVEKEIREQMKDMLGLLNNGYNLSKSHVAILEGLRGDLDALRVSGNDNANSVVDAINNLVSVLHSGNSANGNSFTSYLRSWDEMIKSQDEMLKNHFGTSAGSPNGSSAGSSSGSPFGESSGSACEGAGCLPGGDAGPGDYSGAMGRADGIISGGGKGFAPYTREQIGSLIPSAISTGGRCPVIDRGIVFNGKTYNKKIDFNNLVPGSDFNLAAFIRGVLLITVYFINTFAMIRIFQTGGRG